MTKEERKAAKIAELMEIYNELPDEKLRVASDLIEQAAFMAVTLEDLAEVINAEGVTEEYTNGANQSGRKISSNAKMYSALIGKYASITTKLLQLVPTRPQIPKKKSEIQLAIERDASEKHEQIMKQQEMEKAMMDAFCKAYQGKPQTVEAYRDFKERWLQENPDM